MPNMLAYIGLSSVLVRIASGKETLACSLPVSSSSLRFSRRDDDSGELPARLRLPTHLLLPRRSLGPHTSTPPSLPSPKNAIVQPKEADMFRERCDKDILFATLLCCVSCIKAFSQPQFRYTTPMYLFKKDPKGLVGGSPNSPPPSFNPNPTAPFQMTSANPTRTAFTATDPAPTFATSWPGVFILLSGCPI